MSSITLNRNLSSRSSGSCMSKLEKLMSSWLLCVMFGEGFAILSIVFSLTTVDVGSFFTTFRGFN